MQFNQVGKNITQKIGSPKNEYETSKLFEYLKCFKF